MRRFRSLQLLAAKFNSSSTELMIIAGVAAAGGFVGAMASGLLERRHERRVGDHIAQHGGA